MGNLLTHPPAARSQPSLLVPDTQPTTHAPPPQHPHGAAGLLGENGVTMLRRFTLLALFGTVVTGLNTTDWHHLQWFDLRNFFIPVVSVYAYHLLRTGRTHGAVLAMLWGLTLYILGISFVVQGARTPALIALPVICTFASWLLGLRSAVAMGVLSAVVLAFFAIAEPLGYTPPQVPRNTLAYVLIYVLVIASAILVAVASTRSFAHELQRTHKLSDDLQKQVEELRQSEERFSALFRANPVPSSTNDSDGRIIDVNDAWVRQYGVRREDAIGKTSVEVGIWSDPAERKAVYQELAVRGRVDGAPIYLQAPGGVRKPFLLYIAPVEFGGQQRLVTSILDQTDRHAAEAAQHAYAHELEARVVQRTAELTTALETLKNAQADLVESEKLASLGAMVAGISHELNTPIGNAVTVSSTLRNRIAEIRQSVYDNTLRRSTLQEFLDELQEMSALIQRSTERAAELITSFKQVSVDRTSERRRSFDVQDLVHDIVASIHPDIRKSKIAIHIEQHIPPGMVCDSLPGPIGQVLTNLLHNAMLHAFTGRESGTIAIHARLRGPAERPQVELTVQDDGVGMSEHTRRHAFDAFFTTRMGQGGSGLGLSVSHQLATTVLGGSLSVESQPNQGCCFTFCWQQTLPESPA